MPNLNFGSIITLVHTADIAQSIPAGRYLVTRAPDSNGALTVVSEGGLSFHVNQNDYVANADGTVSPKPTYTPLNVRVGDRVRVQRGANAAPDRFGFLPSTVVGTVVALEQSRNASTRNEPRVRIQFNSGADVGWLREIVEILPPAPAAPATPTPQVGEVWQRITTPNTLFLIANDDPDLELDDDQVRTVNLQPDKKGRPAGTIVVRRVGKMQKVGDDLRSAYLAGHRV